MFGIPIINNAPYTLTAWVNNPEASQIETVANLMPVGNDLATVELRNGLNPSEGIVAHNASFENAGTPAALKQGCWQHWVVTFDGFNERVYCDGKQVSEKNIFLMLRPGGTVTIGAGGAGGNPFTGYLHSLRLYCRPFTAADVAKDMAERKTFSAAEPARLQTSTSASSDSYALNVNRISPDDVEVSVIDGNGNTAPAGFNDYVFAAGTTPACLDNAAKAAVATKVLRIPEGGKTKVYARVTDMFGNEKPVIVAEAGNVKAEFTDMARSLTTARNGKPFVLESESTDLNSDPKRNGPMVTVDVDGDFVMECSLDDMPGLTEKRVPAYNEAGLIVAGLSADGTEQHLLQLGVFPHFNCGNMLTVLDGESRRQYPNNRGFDFDRRLIVERRGDMLYARTCNADGVITEMPGSPVRCPEYLRGKVKVGLYQTTYSDTKASATLSGLKVWVKSK